MLGQGLEGEDDGLGVARGQQVRAVVGEDPRRRRGKTRFLVRPEGRDEVAVLGIPRRRSRVQASRRRRDQRETAAGDAGDDRHHPVPVIACRRRDEQAGAGQLLQPVACVPVPEDTAEIGVDRVEVRRVP